ncbi:MAG: uridine kinase [Candidatus Hydrogenedens sp.]|nr:uridine kinase [Candidatus Hydrogenedens sp.]
MPLMVGIAGPSGAGKSTFARLLAEALGADAAVIPLDAFYRDRADMDAERRAALNFDHPDAIDWSRFFENFMSLQSGATVEIPVYDFATHSRTPETIPIAPVPVVIVEGLHVLWQPALRSLLDFKVYIEAPQTLCLKRRLERDTTERGRAAAEVVRQFKTQTAPLAMEFVVPSKAEAEHVISGDADFAAEAAALSERLR